MNHLYHTGSLVILNSKHDADDVMTLQRLTRRSLPFKCFNVPKHKCTDHVLSFTFDSENNVNPTP